MNFKTVSAVLIAAAISYATQSLAGPGGSSSGPGSSSNQPGGSGGSLTYDDFISVTTNADFTLVREGTLFGYTGSLATTATGGESVLMIADGTFAGNTTITAVDLSDCTSLTAIPSDCFAGCNALASVTLPPSCVNIGPSAFAACTSLKSITAPGVAAVSHDAFRGCTALEAQLSSATLLGSYAYSRSGVTSADTSSATELGQGVFAGCESLTAATTGTALPAATFAGCTALAATDWSKVTEFGTAALAGIPATEISLADGASLADCSFAANEATVITTLTNPELPERTATSFLGREVSYIVNDTDTVRIEANDLVLWLMSVADGTTVLEKTTVTQPSDDDGNTSYATTSLETWLRTRSNLDAVLAYCYDDGAKDLDVLTVEGTNFTFKASDAISVTVTPIGAYDLGSDFTAENVTLQPTSTDGVYTASPVNTAADRFFMRLRFEKAW